MRLWASGLDAKQESEVCCDGPGVLLSEIVCCLEEGNSDNHSGFLLLQCDLRKLHSGLSVPQPEPNQGQSSLGYTTPFTVV